MFEDYLSVITYISYVELLRLIALLVSDSSKCHSVEKFWKIVKSLFCFVFVGLL